MAGVRGVDVGGVKGGRGGGVQGVVGSEGRGQRVGVRGGRGWWGCHSIDRLPKLSLLHYYLLQFVLLVAISMGSTVNNVRTVTTAKRSTLIIVWNAVLG